MLPVLLGRIVKNTLSILRKCKAFILNTYALVICRFFFFLDPLVLIRLGEMETRAIGHFFLPFEIYLSEIDCGIHSRPKRALDLFFKNKKVGNSVVLKKWKKYANIIPAWLIEAPYLRLVRIDPNSKHLVPFRTWRSYRPWQTCDLYGALKKTKTHFEFSDSEIQFAETQLNKIGITATDRFIIFFARDPQFHGGKKEPFSFRDSDINNQLQAMECMVERGYKCIRIGSHQRDRLNLASSEIIDYSFSSVCSELIDLYLLSKCQFMVSTGSGIDTAVNVFRKPIVYVNAAEWGYFDNVRLHQAPLFIPKKIQRISTHEYLTATEISALGANQYSSEESFFKNDVRWVDNSPHEIAEVVIEMEKLYRSGLLGDKVNFTEKQLRFSDLINSFREKDQKIEVKIGADFLESNPFFLI
jgi:putative glycosyltransferase (TIGR04372 family)